MRPRTVVGGILLLELLRSEKNQNVFQTIQLRGGPDVNILKRISGTGAGHRADQQVLREDAIFAGGEDQFARVHALVVHHIVQARVGVAAAFDDAVRACVGQQGARSAVFVVD